ncbi:MAG: hypothetical protein Q8M39_07910 [Sulfuricurvum sp.]|nr:hypothetical protein [Sulfuricurvum sp.]
MNHDELTREVYAHYGLSMYFSQVLEHGIVNALTLIDFIPSNIINTTSRSEWEDKHDKFTEYHFKKTLGSMIKSLKKHIEIENDFEFKLNDALEVRNFLAHHYFQQRTDIFMTEKGCYEMIKELKNYQTTLRDADTLLESVIRPYRIKVGLTDEKLNESLERYKIGDEI